MFKKIIIALTTATLSLVAMNYVRADQGGVIQTERQRVIEECGVGPASSSVADIISYEVCEAAAKNGYAVKKGD
ncbi:hypothetical protein [Pseudochrobactrum asaccharolyticum]|uniref:hypothetical protein n=1 Tax=Pseudochrobactrum asaccharolyticum TaxID=354351 RepID=UPI0040433FCD